MSTASDTQGSKERILAALHAIGCADVASAVERRDVATTRLSDLLKGFDQQNASYAPFLLAEMDDIANHADFILYAAVRDVVAPWRLRRERDEDWRMDLVHYTGLPLPGGEANRSIGHWNPTNQVEVFQVLSGHPTLLSTSASVSSVQVAQLTPGDILMLGGGDWHVTFCPRGEAVILNVYSHQVDVETAGDKYFSKPPIPVGIQLSNGSFSVANPHTVPVEFREPDWRTQREALWKIFTSNDTSAFRELLGE